MNKILHVITTCDRGGAENQLFELVQHQIQLGLDVGLIYLKGSGELHSSLVAIGCSVDSSVVNLSPWKQILKLRKKLFLPDTMIHAHLPRAELMVALCNSAKFVLTRHNAEAFHPRVPRLLSRTLSVFVTSRASAVIAISCAVKSFLLENRECSKKTRIHVIKYGKSFQKSLKKNRHSHSELQKRSLGLNSERRYIGTIARLVEQKDLFTLLRAFQIVAYQSQNVDLIIIGKGHLFDELVHESKRLKIDDRICWVGRTTLIKEYLSVMDSFVLTSIYEGFGLVLLEAVEQDIPIVATNTSAIPEVLGSAYPLLSQLGDPADFATNILKSLDETFSAQAVSRYAQIRANFHIDKISREVMKVYSSL